MRFPHFLFLAILPAGLMVGCASSSQRALDQQVSAQIRGEQPGDRQQVHLDLIRGMLAQKQYYAALAHVEAQKQTQSENADLKLLEAEARRRLGQKEAALQIYRELLASERVAEAYHGLGLSNAGSDLDTAVWQLQQAVQRKPTDAEMRNDLGYALMIAGRHGEALTELATAVELEAGNGDGKARNNLVILMMLTGNETAVRRLAAESGMSDEALAGLRRQAQSLKRRPAPPATRDG